MTYEYTYNGVIGHIFSGTFAQLKKHILENAPEKAKSFIVRYKGMEIHYAINRRVVLSASKTTTNILK